MKEISGFNYFSLALAQSRLLPSEEVRERRRMLCANALGSRTHRAWSQGTEPVLLNLLSLPGLISAAILCRKIQLCKNLACTTLYGMFGL